MPLPNELSQVAIEAASCDVDAVHECLLDEIDYPMNEYFDMVINELTERFGLDEKQQEELHSRMSWKLVLLPPQ